VWCVWCGVCVCVCVCVVWCGVVCLCVWRLGCGLDGPGYKARQWQQIFSETSRPAVCTCPSYSVARAWGRPGDDVKKEWICTPPPILLHVVNIDKSHSVYCFCISDYIYLFITFLVVFSMRTSLLRTVDW